MKRSPMKRGTAWRKARPIVRPVSTPPMPKGWLKVAQRVRARDRWECRRCGRAAPQGHVDHLIPRKLLLPVEILVETNLGLLCGPCHAWKTMVLEPQFYKADILDFELFLSVVEQTGPVPSRALTSAAYGRLREALYA